MKLQKKNQFLHLIKISRLQEEKTLILKKYNVGMKSMNKIWISGFAQEGAQEPIQCEGPCDPCICREVPGLVFDADTNECAWPDEVGCKLTGDSKYLHTFFAHNFCKKLFAHLCIGKEISGWRSS